MSPLYQVIRNHFPHQVLFSRQPALALLELVTMFSLSCIFCIHENVIFILILLFKGSDISLLLVERQAVTRNTLLA